MAKIIRRPTGPKGLSSIAVEGWITNKVATTDLNGNSGNFTLNAKGKLTEADLHNICRTYGFILLVVRGTVPTYCMIRNYPALKAAA